MDGVRSTSRIVEVARSLSPDIVCFQEIHQRLPWSGRENQPVMLQEGLKRRFLFQRNLRVGAGGYGVGMATRATVVQIREHLLPSMKEQRGAQEVRLREMPGIGSLTVFNTHWGLDAQERREQAATLAELVNRAANAILVCGDFNEGRDGEAVTHLLEETGLLDADSGMKRSTFASDNPTDRIDFIFYSPHLRPINVEVVATQASDHLPLLADFVRV